MEYGQCNKSGEPEQHGQGIEAQNGEFVGEAWEVDGREGQIRDCDDHGPDRGEDEEGDAIGGVVGGGVAIVPICDLENELIHIFRNQVVGRLTVCCKTKDDDCEEELQSAKREN